MLKHSPKLALLLTLLLTSLVSCVHGPKIKVYDKVVCSDLAEDGAHCNHTLQAKPSDVSKPEWDKMRVGWFCTDSTGYNDTETSLDQLCNDYGCTYEEHQYIEAFKGRMRDLVARGKRAKKKHHLTEDADVETVSFVEF